MAHSISFISFTSIAFLVLFVARDNYNLLCKMTNGQEVTTNRVAAQGNSIQDDKKQTKAPIAWLMSFPNSGTSYTSYLVRTVTGQLTASNYRSEQAGADAVFEDRPAGPFWTGVGNFDSPTSGYLLTKTHCGETMLCALFDSYCVHFKYRS